MPGLYTQQVQQSDRKTASIAHLRNGTDSVTFWPRIQTLVTMPVGNEVYRRSNFVYTVPKQASVNGVPTLLGMTIFDLTVKANIACTQTEIDAAYAEFVKLIQHADVKRALCEQIRIPSDITTV